jgi:hypothetical protein
MLMTVPISGFNSRLSPQECDEFIVSPEMRRSGRSVYDAPWVAVCASRSRCRMQGTAPSGRPHNGQTIGLRARSQRVQLLP